MSHTSCHLRALDRMLILCTRNLCINGMVVENGRGGDVRGATGRGGGGVEVKEVQRRCRWQDGSRHCLD